MAPQIVDLFIKETKIAAEKKECLEIIENGEVVIPFIVFCRVLGHFNSTNKNESPEESQEQKLKLLFKLYDVDNDGTVSKDEVVTGRGEN